MSDDQKYMVHEYGAEQLPTEVSSALLDYYLKKPASDSKIDPLLNSYNHDNDQVVASETELYTREQHINSLPTWSAFSETVPNLKSITTIDIPQILTTTEEQYFDSYFGPNGCGCERQCHTRFSKSVAFEAHIDGLNLDRYCPEHVNHQHVSLLGALNALVKKEKVVLDEKSCKKENKSLNKSNFKFRGVDVCRNFFLYVFGCGIKRFKNVLKQFNNVGITPLAHENAHTIKAFQPKSTSTASFCQNAVTFILNFAQGNALQLPGRFQKENGQFENIYLLPNQANLGRREIYLRYVQASAELNRQTVSFALWNELWSLQASNVLTVTDQAVELCKVCREYKKNLLNSNPFSKTCLKTGNESQAIELTQNYLAHLKNVQAETEHFQSTIACCKEQYEALLERHKTNFSSALRASFIAELPTMHYSIDWFSTIDLPNSGGGKIGTYTGSSLYFHSAYKVALFGVAIEPLGQFFLYIIPEFVCHHEGHLGSLMISLLEHLFTVATTFKEKEALIDCANICPDQAKNASLLAYLSWRTLIGRHDCITLNYRTSGHSHPWNDLFMSALKKRLRNCTVTNLAEIKTIAENCAMDVNNISEGGNEKKKKSLIRAFLVGDDTESVTLPLYDWSTKLTTISKLSSEVLAENSHYKVDINCPGFVFCKQGPVNCPTTSYRLVSNEAIAKLDAELPGKLHLEPLSFERRLYLYRTIRPYVEAAETLKKPEKPKKKQKKKDVDLEEAPEKTTPPVSKLWAVDKSLHDDEEFVINLKPKTFLLSKTKKVKRSLENQNSEQGKKKTTPRCSYCGELGHRESNFGQISCPKKKTDSQMPTTSTNCTREPQLQPLVSLFEDEDYDQDGLNFDLDQSVFNGIVTEAEEGVHQQRQPQQQTESQLSSTTTITFLE